MASIPGFDIEEVRQNLLEDQQMLRSTLKEANRLLNESGAPPIAGLQPSPVKQSTENDLQADSSAAAQTGTADKRAPMSKEGPKQLSPTSAKAKAVGTDPLRTAAPRGGKDESAVSGRKKSQLKELKELKDGTAAPGKEPIMPKPPQAPNPKAKYTTQVFLTQANAADDEKDDEKESLQSKRAIGDYVPLGERELKLGPDLDFRIRALEEVLGSERTRQLKELFLKEKRQDRTMMMQGEKVLLAKLQDEEDSRSKATEMLSVRSGEMKTLQDQHVAMTDKIENLTSQVAGLSEQKKRRELELRTLKDNNLNLLAKLQAEENAHTHAMDKARKMDVELKSLRSEVDVVRGQVSELQEGKDRLQMRMEQQTRGYDELTKAHHILQDELKKKVGELRVAQRNLSLNLPAEIRKVADRTQKVFAEKRRLESLLQTQGEELENLRADIKGRDTVLSNIRASQATMTNSLLETEKHANRLRIKHLHESTVINAEVTRLNATKEKLLNKCAAESDYRLRAKSELHAKEEEAIMLRKKNIELLGALQSMEKKKLLAEDAVQSNQKKVDTYREKLELFTSMQTSLVASMGYPQELLPDMSQALTMPLPGSQTERTRGRRSMRRDTRNYRMKSLSPVEPDDVADAGRRKKMPKIDKLNKTSTSSQPDDHSRPTSISSQLPSRSGTWLGATATTLDDDDELSKMSTEELVECCSTLRSQMSTQQQEHLALHTRVESLVNDLKMRERQIRELQMQIEQDASTGTAAESFNLRGGSEHRKAKKHLALSTDGGMSKGQIKARGNEMMSLHFINKLSLVEQERTDAISKLRARDDELREMKRRMGSQARIKETDEDEKAHLREQLEIVMLTLEGKQRRDEQEKAKKIKSKINTETQHLINHNIKIRDAGGKEVEPAKSSPKKPHPAAKLPSTSPAKDLPPESEDESAAVQPDNTAAVDDTAADAPTEAVEGQQPTEAVEGQQPTEAVEGQQSTEAQLTEDDTAAAAELKDSNTEAAAAEPAV